ncbi:MAG: hypothetical protein LBJ17_02370 [Dysgonamonadaceae bacterium]|jgi:hypothetical protein|nr:hypothetical protein [Dysgonamonadaceae bacterium]
MKKIIILTVFISTISLITAQETEERQSRKITKTSAALLEYNAMPPEIKNTSITAGLMMGGGSLIGVDFEYLPIQNRIGFQIGAGISSYGAGINYHLKEGANSSFVSFQYYHQGFGDNYYASWLGPMFCIRFMRLFQLSIGTGALIEKGPQWTVSLDEKQQKTTASLLFNIGLYF